MRTIDPGHRDAAVKYARNELYDEHGKLVCFTQPDGQTTFNSRVTEDSNKTAIWEHVKWLEHTVAHLLEERERYRQLRSTTIKQIED